MTHPDPNRFRGQRTEDRYLRFYTHPHPNLPLEGEGAPRTITAFTKFMGRARLWPTGRYPSNSRNPLVGHDRHGLYGLYGLYDIHDIYGQSPVSRTAGHGLSRSPC